MEHSLTTTTAEPAPVVQRFARALLSLDEHALAESSTPELSWIIPGHGLVSGVHVGVPAVISVATTIRRHGIAIEVEQILIGRNGVTAILHETGEQAKKPLDVRVALTLLIQDNRVATITGYISDVDAYDKYLDASSRPGPIGAFFGLPAALLRRPRFDQAGALMATRLAHAGRNTGDNRRLQTGRSA
jgi:limonene-1,2-epoxide hydrolase